MTVIDLSVAVGMSGLGDRPLSSFLCPFTGPGQAMHNRTGESRKKSDLAGRMAHYYS